MAPLHSPSYWQGEEAHSSIWDAQVACSQPSSHLHICVNPEESGAKESGAKEKNTREGKRDLCVLEVTPALECLSRAKAGPMCARVACTHVSCACPANKTIVATTWAARISTEPETCCLWHEADVRADEFVGSQNSKFCVPNILQSPVPSTRCWTRLHHHNRCQPSVACFAAGQGRKSCTNVAIGAVRCTARSCSHLPVRASFHGSRGSTYSRIFTSTSMVTRIRRACIPFAVGTVESKRTRTFDFAVSDIRKAGSSIMARRSIFAHICLAVS